MLIPAGAVGGPDAEEEGRVGTRLQGTFLLFSPCFLAVLLKHINERSCGHGQAVVLTLSTVGAIQRRGVGEGRKACPPVGHCQAYRQTERAQGASKFSFDMKRGPLVC